MTWDVHGIDRYDTPQQPAIQPVDDLSRFIAERIHETETACHETYPVHDEPAGAMAHRYAGMVRADMRVYRKTVALYVAAVAENQAKREGEAGWLAYGMVHGLGQAMLALANRWSDHRNFRDEWRLG